MLMSLGAGMMGAPSFGQGLSRGMQMATQGNQFDIGQQRINASIPILTQRFMQEGMAPSEAQQMALAAVGNPALMQQVLPSLFGPKQWSLSEYTDMLGMKHPFLYNPVTAETRALNIPGQGSGIGGGGAGIDGGAFPGVDATKTGWDYLTQFPSEIQAATKAYMSGGVMPSGNPRNQGIASLAKTIAQKVAMDVGEPQLADDTLYAQRRATQTSLGGSGNSQLGGIIANGKSAFDHLANLSDKFVNLGNYSGPDIPGGAHLGEIGNIAENVILPSPQRSDLITQTRQNLEKYGQEATKFYAGSGGGEAERLGPVHELNPARSLAAEQAGFLQSQKELMVARLREQENKIRQDLGQAFLDRHPVVTPDLQGNLAKIDANIARLRGGQSSAVSPSRSAAPAAAANMSGVPIPSNQPHQSYLYNPATGQLGVP
jgi:hypothetical protein